MACDVMKNHVLTFTLFFPFVVDCPDPSCSGQGVCVAGACICRKGWEGARCAEREASLSSCLPTCSARGTFDSRLGRCNCAAGYTGVDCSKGELFLEYYF